jgi:alpha-galactosidase/6-phospho-beta-glucosidase family protein
MEAEHILITTRPSCKIAIIGGGSRYWARDLMKDLAVKAKFDGEIALYDLKHDAAQKNVEIGKRIFERPEAVSKFKVCASKTLASCLKGADFVVISIEPGAMELRYADLEIPRAHGVVQPVGDSTGPGGWLRALRAIPVFADFAHAIMANCPKAWVINYTNPMTLCTRALYAAEPQIKAFGCCHEVFGTQHKLGKVAEDAFGMENLRLQEVVVNINGVNHFTWVTEAHCRGQDLFPALREKISQPDFFADRTRDARKRVRAKKYFGSHNLVSHDLFRRFGALGAAGDRHLAEFVPWYARDEKTLHRWGVVCTPYSYRIESRGKEDVAVDTYGQKAINPSGELGVEMIEALLGLRILDTNVNLPNHGQSPGLPQDAVVETNAAFRLDRVTPFLAKPLPRSAHSLVARVVDVQEDTLSAALARDLDAAREALFYDPLITLSTDRCATMADEMLDHVKKELSALGYRY